MIKSNSGYTEIAAGKFVGVKIEKVWSNRKYLFPEKD